MRHFLRDPALALNPNDARGWLISGALRTWAGQPDIGIEHLETSLRLSPRARIGTTLRDASGFGRSFMSQRVQCWPPIAHGYVMYS